MLTELTREDCNNGREAKNDDVVRFLVSKIWHARRRVEKLKDMRRKNTNAKLEAHYLSARYRLEALCREAKNILRKAEYVTI